MQFSRRCQAANPNGALSGNWTQQQVVHGDGKQWVAESSGAKRGWARSATSSGAKCYSIFAGLHASEDFRPKPSQEANLHQTNGLMATLDLNRRRESNRMKQQTGWNVPLVPGVQVFLKDSLVCPSANGVSFSQIWFLVGLSARYYWYPVWAPLRPSFRTLRLKRLMYWVPIGIGPLERPGRLREVRE